MNNDLISRSALLTVPNVRKVTEYDEGGWGMSYNAVPEEAIEKAPAVDAVEVVRCKDCRSFMKYNPKYKPEVEGADGDCYIRLVHTDCEPQFCAVQNDDYCSLGRKSDELGER